MILKTLRNWLAFWMAVTGLLASASYAVEIHFPLGEPTPAIESDTPKDTPVWTYSPKCPAPCSETEIKLYPQDPRDSVHSGVISLHKGLKMVITPPAGYAVIKVTLRTAAFPGNQELTLKASNGTKTLATFVQSSGPEGQFVDHTLSLNPEPGVSRGDNYGYDCGPLYVDDDGDSEFEYQLDGDEPGTLLEEVPCTSPTPTPTETPPPPPPPIPFSFSGGNDSYGQTTGSQQEISSLNTPQNSPCNNQGCSGQPVNLATGALWHQAVDFSVLGRTTDTALTFRRTYLAQAAAPPGDLGKNWRHNWETELLSQTNPNNPSALPNLVWIDENGGPWVFTATPPTTSGGLPTYTAPSGLFATLTEFYDHYELRKQNGTTLYFSDGQNGNPPAGKLMKITERHGESIDLNYDPTTGLLVSVVSPLAGTLEFIRDSQTGLVTEVVRTRDFLSSDPTTNLTYTYTYNQGRLASESDFQGNTYKYTYLSGSGTNNFTQGLLNTITDPLNRTTTFTYYPNAQAYQQFEPGGGIRTFVYSATGSKTPNTQVTEVDGYTTTYYFDSDGRTIKTVLPDGSTSSQTWDPVSGHVSSVTDEMGNTTHYGFDAQGNLDFIRRPLDPPGGTRITYDQTFNVPIKVVSPLSTEAVTCFTLDPANGDVVQVQRALGQCQLGQGLSISFSRDPFGNVISTNNGRAIYSNEFDPNGLETFVFDAHNPETRKYDQRFRLAERDFKSGRILHYFYDDFDRVTQIVDNEGPATSFTYDVMGKLLTKTVTDGNTNQVTSYGYDARDRIATVTDPLGRITTNTYDIPGSNGAAQIFANPVATTDPKGNTTDFAFDKRDRLVSQRDAKGGETSYSYYPNSQLQTLIDPDGNQTVFQYDPNDRLQLESQPTVLPNLGSATGPYGVAAVKNTSFQYDADDHLTLQTTSTAGSDGTQAQISQSYDPFDRLQEKVQSYVGGPFAGVYDDSVYQYEPQLDTTRLISAVNGVENLGFDYEETPPFADRAFSVAPSQQGPAGLIQDAYKISYDVTGNIASIVNSAGKVLYSKTYDPVGRLIQATSGAGLFGAQTPVLQAALSYDSFGRRSGASFSDGWAESIAYDQANQLRQLQWSRGVAERESETLNYDLAGNVSKQIREHGTFDYSFDPNNQLTGAQTQGFDGYLPYNVSLQYDAAGNRTVDSRTGQNQIVANALVEDPKRIYVPDAQGFGSIGSIANQKTSYTQDLFNRPDGKLATFTADSSGLGTFQFQVGYLYDPLGRRVAKQYYAPTACTITFSLNQFQLPAAGGNFQITATKSAACGNATVESLVSGSLQCEPLSCAQDNSQYSVNVSLLSSTPGSDGSTAETYEIQIGNGNPPVSQTEVYTITDPSGANSASLTLGSDLTETRSLAQQPQQHQPQQQQTQLELKFQQDFVYLADEDRILLGQAGDGTQTLYIDGEGTDEHLGQVNAKKAKGYVTDHEGSVLNTDVAGDVHGFGAFGESRSEKSLALTAQSDPAMYGYTGRSYDPESGLYYYRARMYAPGLGRFTEQDPAGNIGGDFNLYRYADGNPTIYYDPYGFGIWYAYIGATAVYGGGGQGVGGSIAVGTAYDDSTGQHFYFYTTASAGQVSGIYGGGGLSGGYFNGAQSQFFGSGNSSGESVGEGLISEEGTMNSSQGAHGFSLSPPFAGVGFGAAAYSLNTQTSPIGPAIGGSNGGQTGAGANTTGPGTTGGGSSANASSPAANPFQPNPATGSSGTCP